MRVFSRWRSRLRPASAAASSPHPRPRQRDVLAPHADFSASAARSGGVRYHSGGGGGVDKAAGGGGGGEGGEGGEDAVRAALDGARENVRAGALLMREGHFGAAEKKLVGAVTALDALLARDVCGKESYDALGGALMDLGVVLDCQKRIYDAARCYTDALAAYALVPGGADGRRVAAVERNLERNEQKRVADEESGGGVGRRRTVGRMGGRTGSRVASSKEYYRGGRTRSRSLFGSGSSVDPAVSGAYSGGRLSGLSYASSTRSIASVVTDVGDGERERGRGSGGVGGVGGVVGGGGGVIETPVRHAAAPVESGSGGVGSMGGSGRAGDDRFAPPPVGAAKVDVGYGKEEVVGAAEASGGGRAIGGPGKYVQLRRVFSLPRMPSPARPAGREDAGALVVSNTIGTRVSAA